MTELHSKCKRYPGKDYSDHQFLAAELRVKVDKLKTSKPTTTLTDFKNNRKFNVRANLKMNKLKSAEHSKSTRMTQSTPSRSRQY